MTAILLIAFFAASALLAVGAMVVSWKQYGTQFAEARSQLREADHQVAVRYQWLETAAAQRSALVYQLKFTPRADGLPFHPELSRELAAAA